MGTERGIKVLGEIIIAPSELWDYFIRNEKTLKKEQHKIAACPEYGVIIYVTESQGYPNIIAEADDIVYEEEVVINDVDCSTTARRFYDEYLTEKFLEKTCELDICDDPEDDIPPETEESRIEEREDELDAAISDFLYVVLGAVVDIPPESSMREIKNDVKEHFLKYLADKHGFKIYRPMFLEDVDTGEDFFTEYPYECLVE